MKMKKKRNSYQFRMKLISFKHQALNKVNKITNTSLYQIILHNSHSFEEINNSNKFKH